MPPGKKVKKAGAGGRDDIGEEATAGIIDHWPSKALYTLPGDKDNYLEALALLVCKWKLVRSGEPVHMVWSNPTYASGPYNGSLLYCKGAAGARKQTLIKSAADLLHRLRYGLWHIYPFTSKPVP